MPDWWVRKPAWRLTNLEMEGPYGWGKVDRDTLDYIRGKLRNFESMSLIEIFIKARKQNHSAKVHLIALEAQKRLQELRLYDVDRIHCLRFSGKQRVGGFITENVVNLLWWDPEHQVFPSAKKHT